MLFRSNIRFCSLSPKVHHVLKITGLLEVFEIVTSEEEAVRSFAGGMKASA